MTFEGGATVLPVFADTSLPTNEATAVEDAKTQLKNKQSTLTEAQKAYKGDGTGSTEINLKTAEKNNTDAQKDYTTAATTWAGYNITEDQIKQVIAKTSKTDADNKAIAAYKDYTEKKTNYLGSDGSGTKDGTLAVYNAAVKAESDAAKATADAQKDVDDAQDILNLVETYSYNDVVARQEALNKLNAAKGTQSAAQKDYDDKVTAYNKAKKAYDDEVAKYKGADHTKTKKAMDDAETDMKNAEKALNAAKDAVTKAQSDFDYYDKIVSETQATRTVRYLSTRLQTAKDNLTKVKNSYNLDQLQKNADEADTEYQNAVKALADAGTDTTKIAAANEKLKTTGEAKKNADKALADAQAAIEAAQSKVDTLQTAYDNAVKTDNNSTTSSDVAVYRLFNTTTGEHLYTTDSVEYNYLGTQGWVKEDVKWYAPATGTKVTRLFDTVNGGHLYTTDANEVSVLLTRGWVQDGDSVTFNSGDSGVTINRLFDTVSGQHLLTGDQTEVNYLTTSSTWVKDDTVIYAVKLGK